MYAKADTESHRFFTVGRTRSSPEVCFWSIISPKLRQPVKLDYFRVADDTSAIMASTTNLRFPAVDSQGSRGIVVVKLISTQQATLEKPLGRQARRFDTKVTYALDSKVLVDSFKDVILPERGAQIAVVPPGQAKGTYKFSVVQRDGDIVTGESDFVLLVQK